MIYMPTRDRGLGAPIVPRWLADLRPTKQRMGLPVTIAPPFLVSRPDSHQAPIMGILLLCSCIVPRHLLEASGPQAGRYRYSYA